MDLERTIGMTVTGEIFHPVRLYYKVFDRSKFEKHFKCIKCIEFGEPRNRWVWLYEKEAKSIKFKNEYSSLPQEVRPVVIGSFTWKNDKDLILDLRSFERALEAIKFFDKKIPRSIAKVTHCATVNKIFEVQESVISNFDVFFENNNELVEIDPEAFINRAKSLSTEAMTSFLEDEMSCFSEVEKFPLYFHEDGINSIKASFILRQTIAMERWKGNANYSFKDVWKRIFDR